MKRFFSIYLLILAAASAHARGSAETNTSDTTPPRNGTPPAFTSESNRPVDLPTPESGSARQAVPLLEEYQIRPFPRFQTDFSRTTISREDILDGGPPKDGIPAIDTPRFVSVDEAGVWIGPQEPVFAVAANGVTHLYPVQILTYHEIVNDVVGNTPVAVTFCPLCNTGITFARDFDGKILDFGTTGRLRYSNLLMYDRQTESWWQQATGAGVIGEYAGYQLELYPMLMVPWDVAVERYPDARVLSRDTGHDRNYGTNPYVGYDSGTPFLYEGPGTPEELNPMARILQVIVNEQSLAVPYPVVSEQRLIQQMLGGRPIVVFWEPGTASALDTRTIGAGRDVGAANAFLAEHNGRTLEFARAGAGFRDLQTQTVWDATGTALRGELAGAQLEPMVGIQHFWFSYTAFALDERWTEQD